MFKWFKKRIETAKKRHRKKPVCTVPVDEYEFLKWVHVTVASGKGILIGGPAVNEQTMFKHAKMLKDHYGLDEIEILDVTGFWVLEKQL